MSVRPVISLREQVNVANSFYKIFRNQNNSADEKIFIPLENIAFLHYLLKNKIIFLKLISV
jgi:hypothetical protein